MWGIMKKICLLMIIITKIFRWVIIGKDTNEEVDFRNINGLKRGMSSKLDKKKLCCMGHMGLLRRKRLA